MNRRIMKNDKQLLAEAYAKVLQEDRDYTANNAVSIWINRAGVDEMYGEIATHYTTVTRGLLRVLRKRFPNVFDSQLMTVSDWEEEANGDEIGGDWAMYFNDGVGLLICKGHQASEIAHDEYLDTIEANAAYENDQ